ncbi:ABC transporter ATP-binding protein [Gluconobacter morbifer]|uniref:Ferrichrome ABC transporter ATP-binding protein n=1 Tax=Gluconobacter morbifer G707 TaxID=1088869 RepID=G6XJL4_9PROT|nr:ABC transporter ATP-binding protein [Gluconobacter morbifer]EHH68119.1 ferrichrome ABC transporter ATP-binding protein [Gluconobacter morbifer G707]
MNIRVDGLELRFQDRVLLDGVTLKACRGEVLGLIGPNGAGKTTLLRTMAGLQTPTAGTVLLDHRPLGDLPVEERGRLLAYLPQDAPAPTDMTVREVVALGRLPHRRFSSASEDGAAIQKAIAAVEMEAFAERSARQLSGGERSRVLLARALAVQAPVLLVDEPVAALDPAQALAVMMLLRRLAEEGRAVVVVLHDLMLAARFCSRLAVLRQGRLDSAGTPGNVLTDRMFADVYGVSVRRYGDVLLPWSRLP